MKLPSWHVPRVPVMVSGDVSEWVLDLCSTGLWLLLDLARPCEWGGLQDCEDPYAARFYRQQSQDGSGLSGIRSVLPELQAEW